MDKKRLLLVEKSGDLRAVVGGPRGQLRQLAGNYKILLDSPQFLILGHETDGALGEPSEAVLMAGRILTSSTVLEIVNTIASSRWIGTLHVFGHDSHRSLGFYEGAVRHAQSDHPEDRLDKVLGRVGLVNPAQVERVLRDIRPDQRFGELLLESGVLDHQQLFEHLRKQMQQILLAAVLESTGTYVFTLSDSDDEAPSATAHIPLHGLLLTAAERLDRFVQYRNFVPDAEMRPEVLPGVELTRFSARERLLIGYSDGDRSLAQIASETWLGTYETFEVAAKLTRGGQIRLLPPLYTRAQRIDKIVDPFNRLLGEIFDAIEPSGESARLRAEIEGWIETSTDAALPPGCVGLDGQLDVPKIADSLSDLGNRYQLEVLREALHELTSYALFCASLWLPREEERELATRINRQLKAIRR